MHWNSRTFLLYAVTDRTWLKGRTLCQVVEEALKGGVTCVQLREKELDRAAFCAEARALLPLCRQYGVPLIINDDVDVALEVDADGVHLGQDDLDLPHARRRLGPDKLIGVSAHNVEEATLAQEQGADYLGVGAVFGSSTKQDANALPPGMLQKVCAAVDLPVVAIGGVNKDNLPRLAGSGIAGAAIVSGIFAQENVEGAAQELKELLADIIPEK